MTKNDKERREKIIEAAYKVLSEKGYDRASTKEIAQCAGIAQGLINYYFSSKDELFMEVIKKESDRYCDHMCSLMKQIPPEQLFEYAKEDTKQRVLTHPEWFRIRYELFALGLRNPQLQPRIQQLLEEARNNIASMFSLITNQPKEHFTSVASIIVACMDGIALQKLIDPNFDSNLAHDTLGQMFEAMFESLNKP